MTDHHYSSTNQINYGGHHEQQQKRTKGEQGPQVYSLDEVLELSEDSSAYQLLSKYSFTAILSMLKEEIADLSINKPPQKLRFKLVHHWLHYLCKEKESSLAAKEILLMRILMILIMINVTSK